MPVAVVLLPFEQRTRRRRLHRYASASAENVGSEPRVRRMFLEGSQPVIRTDGAEITTMALDLPAVESKTAGYPGQRRASALGENLNNGRETPVGRGAASSAGRPRSARISARGCRRWRTAQQCRGGAAGQNAQPFKIPLSIGRLGPNPKPSAGPWFNQIAIWSS